MSLIKDLSKEKKQIDTQIKKITKSRLNDRTSDSWLNLRELKKKCIAVIITSDKSYKNLEIRRGYKEDDIFGGSDPDSASKGSAELAIQSYISSFFNIKKTPQNL